MVLLPVSIAAKMIIHIAFVIFNKIATNEDEQADRISLYVIFFGFILSMVPLVTDLPTYWTFLVRSPSVFYPTCWDVSLNYTFTKKEFDMGKDAISNQIRNLRFHHNGMTQQQLADKAGVTCPDRGRARHQAKGPPS
ncbi:hypothetical protein [Cohnella algarum]|uniref:hypothetical protein n=1 Tax=Cohnella algarum TaxID=2044859 RepID=UPI001F07291B|nr:hypothetical protein [Cohnella algarum]